MATGDRRSELTSSSSTPRCASTSGWSSTTSGKLYEVSLAYAITTHESQGWDFPANAPWFRLHCLNLSPRGLCEYSTLSLEKLQVSEVFGPLIAARPDLNVSVSPHDMDFDHEGNLLPLPF
jgi:hypothetical protein